MSYWANPEIKLGIIKAGSPKKVVFKGLETMPVIKVIAPYCGCTTTNYNDLTKELEITYSNSKLPDQVQGAQVSEKRIDITYEDDTTEVLTIKSTRIR
jgi:hypothetical protein